MDIHISHQPTNEQSINPHRGHPFCLLLKQAAMPLRLQSDLLFVNIDSSILVVLLMDFLLHDTALLRSSVATNQGGITVKMLRDFLKRGVAGLNVEEEYEHELKGKPDALMLC